MREAILLRGLVACVACVACVERPQDGSVGVVSASSTIEDVRVTWYTLVTEASTSGQHTGDRTVLCGTNGLSGCYHKEFLCSGWGVAMQGTGIANGGEYVKWISGGGGWAGGYRWLNNCASARFAVVNSVRGASGRQVVQDYSIAVDPQLIPLGSYVWVESERQWFRADDTGGAVKGRHIDIFRGSSSRTVAADRSTIFVSSVHRDRNDPSPFGDGPAQGCPTDHTSCGNGNCCPSSHPICCADDETCGADPSCAGPREDCSTACGNGACCPSTHPYCCDDGTCGRSACGGPGPDGADGGSPPLVCPDTHPIDCLNGFCCPDEWPYCCADGTCAAQPC